VKFDAFIPAPLSVVEVTYLPLATAAEDAGEVTE
jgi:hypothetical protein